MADANHSVAVLTQNEGEMSNYTKLMMAVEWSLCIFRIVIANIRVSWHYGCSILILFFYLYFDLL